MFQELLHQTLAKLNVTYPIYTWGQLTLSWNVFLLSERLSQNKGRVSSPLE